MEAEIKQRAQGIELVNIDVLQPHPKNMHLHSDAQIERLSKLIEYQGFRNPLIVQKGTQLVVAGHGRLMAAKKLELKQVPVIYQEFESEEQLYGYLVSDNAIGKDDWAKLDLSQINQDIVDLGPDLDIELLGIKNFVVEPIDRLDPDGDGGNGDDEKEKQYLLEVKLPNEMELRDLYDDLTSKGYMVKEK